MGKYRLLSVLFLSGVVSLTTAHFKRDDKLEVITDYFEKLRAEYPGEKVHLHFDKPYYSIGEDIWFKAYVVNAEKNELSGLSKVLYVDVIDEQDSIRKTLTLPITNGLANSSINLADSVFDSGNYRIRAHTRWMENFDSSYYFDKQISIGDALNSGVIASSSFSVTPNKNDQLLAAELNYRDLNNRARMFKPVSYSLMYDGKEIFNGKGQTDLEGKLKFSAPVKSTYPINKLTLSTTIQPNNGRFVDRDFSVGYAAADVDIQFFPEGGNLVNGVRSKVAFKALSTNGLGIAVDGYIEDQQKNKLIELNTAHAGMGVFAFTPQVGEQYTAVINLKEGKQKRIALPVAKIEGYVMALNHAGADNINLKISTSANLVQGQEVLLMAHANNAVQYVSRIKIDNPSVATTISKKYFSDGLVHFTLFTPDYMPIAERLIFVEKPQKVQADIKTDKTEYTKRQAVSLQIDVKDQLEQPVVGAFSVAVTNKSKVGDNEEDETTIKSNLLLISDLKGFVEKPNYYFSPANAERVRDLDILMLTQGWSRFKWDDVKANKYPTITHKAEQSLTITGRIVSLGGKPMPFAKVTLLAPSALLITDTVADANGSFVLENLDLDEGVKVVIKAKNAKDRDNAKIIMDAPILRVAKSKLVLSSNELTPSFLNYLKASETQFNELSKYGLVKKNTMLKQVVIKAQGPPKIENSVINPYERPVITLTPEQLQSSVNLLNLIPLKAGMITKNNKIYGMRGGLMGPMGILFDGVVMDDMSMITPQALAGVQVYRHFEADAIGRLYSNLSAAYGVIVLTSETKITKYNRPRKPSIDLLSNRGYSLAKEFYSPVYKPDKEAKMADLRSTIYWKPDVVTDNEGKAKLNFFTADEPGTYLVTMEGLDTKGNLVRKTYNFNVKL